MSVVYNLWFHVGCIHSSLLVTLTTGWPICPFFFKIGKDITREEKNVIEKNMGDEEQKREEVKEEKIEKNVSYSKDLSG